MTLSDNPNADPNAATGGPIAEPAFVPPVGANDLAPPAAGTAVTTAPAPDPQTTRTRPSGGDSDHGGGKIKAAAVVAAATALANKVREEAPKKVREIRDKRAVGRRVIIAEVDGRTVAIGPFAGSEDAHRSAKELPGARVVELLPASSASPEESNES